MSDPEPLVAASPAPLVCEHATERPEQSFSRLAISSRYKRLVLVNTRTILFFLISLAAASVAFIGLCLAFNAEDSHTKSEFILALSISFAVEVGAIALLVTSYFTRVTFVLQVAKEEALRGDFCIYSVVQLVEICGDVLSTIGVLLFGWALSAVLRANTDTWFSTYKALFLIPLSIMIVVMVCACLFTFVTCLPPQCNQRAYSSWPDARSLKLLGNTAETRGRWALAMARSQDWLAYRNVMRNAPAGTTLHAVEETDPTKLGWRALHWAAYHNDDGLASHIFAMSNKDDIDVLFDAVSRSGPAFGQNPFHVAAIYGSVETCRAMVESDKRVVSIALAQRWNGRTPLEVALELENYRVATILATATKLDV